MIKKRNKTGLFSLKEKDIQSDSWSILPVDVKTGVKAGSIQCKRPTQAEARACCDQLDNAGALGRTGDGQWACQVADEGSWDND